jgi:hypothetical protein
MNDLDNIVNVEYYKPIDKKLDNKIKKAMEGIGLKWYAQGYDLARGIRDISFDMVKKTKGVGNAD